MYEPKSKRVQKRAKQITNDFVDGLERGMSPSDMYPILAKRYEFTEAYIRKLIPVKEARKALALRYVGAQG
ncbi:MAG: hypothetical protein HWD92_08830 [Flavobacteriia bacterium]|nr:hypothetical protein [Flavobacteriia bacterium]